MPHILVVEDNVDINDILRDILLDQYEITQAYSGTEAIALIERDTFDLVLLDIMLPGKDGGQVLQAIRQQSQIPVLMITAIGDKKTISQYLLNGANDYITKPFDSDEVRARIHVQLRQASGKILETTCHNMTYGQICLDPTSLTLKGPQGECLLRKREYDILCVLLQHPKQVFTKEKLYELIWNDLYIPGDNTLNAHLSNLRKRLKQVDPDQEYIETLWGLGVRLKELPLCK